MLIAIVFAVTVAILLRHAIDLFLKFGLGQSGEFAQWQMTVRHDPTKSLTPHDYWTIAVDHIEQIGGELIRQWNSHGSTGDRLNREYKLPDGKILLEFDRWNGVTLSGNTVVAKPLGESIAKHVVNAR